jgi:choline dehydrogenase-like flavoprotein
MSEPSTGHPRLFTDSRETIRAIVDAIVPGDDFPSASDAGGLDFLESAIGERPGWGERLERVIGRIEAASSGPFAQLSDTDRCRTLDALATDEDYAWLAALVNAGYYADAGSGGNRGHRSWRMVGWSRAPHGGWPPADEHLPPESAIVQPSRIRPRYDAIVIGSGAGGGVAACGLAESGRSVLVVEAGPWPGTRSLSVDHLRNPRSNWGFESLTGPPDAGNPRVVDEGGQRLVVAPSDPRWSGNAMIAGGGTRVYGAQAWRFTPDDFAMATRYGVPDGSSLADWPFGYDELEPYYRRAEWEVGVSGDSTGGTHSGPRSAPHPMPPVRTGRAHQVLGRGARELGISTLSVPLLINSIPFLGRGACTACAMCVGFACPVDAKNGSQNTMLSRAFATGRCSMLLDTRVERLVADSRGEIVAAVVVGMADGATWRQQIAASEFVIAAGAVESARLLLHSASDQEPNGLGNNTDQVGRHLQAHSARGPIGLFEDEIEDLTGPGPSIATTDFRHGNEGIVGGGMIANDFIPLPSNTYRYLTETGLIPLHGLAAKRGMREFTRRMVKLYTPIQEVTTAESRVRLDARVTDQFGIPAARLSGGLHPEDLRARDFLTERATEWLRASGAHRIGLPVHASQAGPSGGQHQAGTCRMGDDPATSVTDPWGRVWGHANVRVADGSVHVTNGGVNPVLTIYANAMRIIENMAGGWAESGPPGRP